MSQHKIVCHSVCVFLLYVIILNCFILINRSTRKIWDFHLLLIAANIWDFPPGWCIWWFTVVLIENTLNSNDVENIFICLITLWISSFFKFFFFPKNFVQFKVGGDSVFCYWFERFVGCTYYKYLSLLVAFLFNLLIVSYDEWTFLTLI